MIPLTLEAIQSRAIQMGLDLTKEECGKVFEYIAKEMPYWDPDTALEIVLDMLNLRGCTESHS